MAENHPVGFQWVIEAREKNHATVIHVDPRYTRTSAMSDIWVPLRPGSDLLFLGGLINYVLTNDKMFRDYVLPYTNIANIINEDFQDTEDLDGVFSGWDEANLRYDPQFVAVSRLPGTRLRRSCIRSRRTWEAWSG